MLIRLLDDLMERRVPHVLAIYAGASWGLIEFTEFLVGTFLLSQRLTILVMAALFLLLPSVAMLAWFHGRRGRDDVPLAEKIGIPVNLAVAASVLLVLFRGQHLGATTTAVYVETDEGEFVERRVPKPEFRRRAALFPFDAGPGLREDDAWVPYIVPIALELDLGDAEFFEPVPPDMFAPQLAQLGFEDLQGVPIPLKRELSEESRAELVASGTVDRADAEDEYRVTFAIHSASTGSRVSETVYEGRDFLALIDRMSAELAEALEIPDYTDLPVRERMTADDEALEAFGRGVVQLLVPPWDLDVALDEFGAATMFDPTFALAQYQFALLLNNAGRPAEAVASLRTAITHRYRLPERTDFMVNFEYFWLTGQMDEAWAVSERWATVRPDDRAALAYLSAVQTVRDDWEGLLGTLRTLHGLSPDDHSLLLQMADAHLRLGDDEQALEAVARYVAQAPDDYSGYVEMARIQRRRGRHESAREQLTQALLIHPTMPELVTERASLDLEVGRFQAALRGYEEALDFANTPEQRIGVLAGLKSYYRLRGQLEEAIRTADAWLDEASMVLTPAEIAQDRFPDIDLYLDAGRVRDAGLLLDRLQAEQPPMADFLVPHYRIHVALGAGDSGAARAAYDAAIEAIKAYGVEAFRPRVIADLGRIEELDGDYESAIQRYREAMAMEPGRNLHRETSRALRKAGRLQEAESELREALRKRPAEPHAHLEMALVLEARGEAERAREHVERALAAWEPADASFEPGREARAMLTASSPPTNGKRSTIMRPSLSLRPSFAGIRSLLAVWLVAGCAYIQREYLSGGARFATTPEAAPVAWFDTTESATRHLIADWCSRPGDSGGYTSRPTGSPPTAWRNQWDSQWALDGQSDGLVVCSGSRREADYSSDGAHGTEITYEWVTFTLWTGPRGGTCVVGAPEVERNETRNGVRSRRGRRMGSYTNFEEILAELGGSVSAEEKAACSLRRPSPAPADTVAAHHADARASLTMRLMSATTTSLPQWTGAGRDTGGPQLEREGWTRPAQLARRQ